MQHVKPRLMQRIARMTGAAILASTDHVVSQPAGGRAALGACVRFRLLALGSLLVEGSLESGAYLVELRARELSSTPLRPQVLSLLPVSFWRLTRRA